jgi:hypothetical protein
MNLTAGIILLIIFAGMFWFGKPHHGVSPRFLQIYIVGVIYTMVCMTAFVLGVASIIISFQGLP